MRVSTEDLARALTHGLAPLYTVYGAEPLLALEATDRIRAAALTQGFSERVVLTVEQHFDWSQLRIMGQSLSLFSTQRLLELRIPNGKPGSDGAQALQSHASALPSDTVTLIYLPQIDSRAQKSLWFTALDAGGVTVEAKQVSRAALPAWLSARLKSQEQSADPQTLRFIADKVEGNLLAAYQEVQKLALLLPPGRLSFEQVKEAVLDVARFDMFTLGEAIIAGDARHVVRIVEGLKGEGAAPPLILWVITEEIRALGRVIAAVSAGRPMQQALRDARVWGGARQNLFQSRAPGVSQAQVEAALMHAARLDRMTKGLLKGDLWDELTQLALRFAPEMRPVLAETR